MKQNITEAEREAKRMRRVLANRESARRTIRRRQAFREELMRRIADLSVDNENMKMEKELVMKEYLLLRDRNIELKDEMAKAMKMKSDVELAAAIPSTSLSTELSLAPPKWSSCINWFPWPSISSDAIACYDEGCSGNVPLHASFYLLHNQTSGPYPPCSKSSSNEGVETGAIEEERNDAVNLEEMPGFDEQDKILIHDPDGDARDEQDTGIKVDEKMTGHVEIIVTEKAEAVSFVPSVKKSRDPTTTTAAARKKREELMKLKSLHGRQNRMNG